jgi:hypothetical protein
MFLVTVLLFALGAYGVARTSRRAMRRLGLDPMETLLWLGLAEWPSERAPRRRRPERAAADQPAPRRGRSPHRRASRSAARRRSAPAS